MGQWNWISHRLNEVICKPTPLLCSYYTLAPTLGESEPYSKAPTHLSLVAQNSSFFEVLFSRQYVNNCNIWSSPFLCFCKSVSELFILTHPENNTLHQHAHSFVSVLDNTFIIKVKINKQPCEFFCFKLEKIISNVLSYSSFPLG